MPAPKPTRLFHITAIANLPSICAAGSLVAKNAGAANGIGYQNISHSGAQRGRSMRAVPDPPGGFVHDFVPFYFAPRSPMLSAIDRGKVTGCDWRQGDIVHLETTVERAVALGRPFVFYDRNATLAYSTGFTDLAELDTAVAWDLLTEPPCMDGFCKFWNSMPSSQRYADRMERRQAEFLVKASFPVAAVTRLGGIDGAAQRRVQDILATANVDLRVDIMRDWYF